MNKHIKLIALWFLAINLFNPFLLSAQNDTTKKTISDVISDFDKIEHELGLSASAKFNDYCIKQYIGYRNNENTFVNAKTESIIYQIISTYLSFLGAYNEALIYRDKESINTVITSVQDSLYLLGLNKEDAFETISKMVDTVRIVMINEAHHIPQHRILSTKLLNMLYEKGFRYFCAETLDNSDSTKDKNLNTRKYPIMKTGFYSMEPLYGDMIRQALKIGFTVVPYERSRLSTRDREIEQAGNIFQIFQNDPNAKVFVHCGYDHLTPRWMAGNFKKISGIRPLTINQTQMMEYSQPIYSCYFSQLVNTLYEFDKPIVLADSNGNLALNYKRNFDVIIFNPPTKYIYDRPDWMAMNGYRKIFNLNEFNLDKINFVQAIFADEDIDMAVPVDQTLVNNDNPVLFLPAGDFNLKFLDAEGNLVYKKLISMK